MGQKHTDENPTTISPNEKEAVKVANQCKDFIAQVKNLSTSSIINDFIIQQYQILQSNISIMLERILNEAIEFELTEIQNYYYLYLLQQTSRFNQFFNQTNKITDKRNSKQINSSFQSKDWDGLNKLRKANILPIEHLLLNQSSNLQMDVTITVDKIFDDPHIDNDDGPRYYYHPRSTPPEEMHQDRSHYYEANANIGIPTQLSNAAGFFKSNEPGWGQSRNAYFKPADKALHDAEQQLFRSAISKIQAGNPLSQDERDVLKSGKYYRYNSPVKFRVPCSNSLMSNAEDYLGKNYQTTHIGHAAEYISFQNSVPLRLVIDPVHYQTGTGGPGGLIGLGGKILYDRHTDPAFGTDGYPGFNIALLSHNHHDHLCERSTKETSQHSNTLWIIPAGDAQYMKKWDISNFIEMSSWNDVLTIHLKDPAGNSSQYEIRSFPANHASCRGPTDFFESLYMGYLIRDLNTNEVILCTGDTAVLSEKHFNQLSNYLIEHKLYISTAFIAHGPDRPRQWMKCSHQSTADALTMHAQFNVMNAYVFKGKENKNELFFEDLKKSACYGIGYHQGCYRLGLLSLSDVDTTILRTLTVLKSLGELPIAKITKLILGQNVFYHFMDKFEQEGLRNTLKAYKKLELDNGCLTASQVLELIISHLHVPQPGYRADFSKPEPYDGFSFEYYRLLLNKNPQMKAYNDSAGAFEYFCYHLEPKYYQDNFDKQQLVTTVLRIYLNRKNSIREEKIQQFVNNINKIPDDKLDQKLGELYSDLFPQQDEGIRDEGHSHTAITIIAGLLHFPDFRKKMLERYHELKGNIVLEEGNILNKGIFSL